MEFNELLPVLKEVFPNCSRFDEKMTKKEISDWDSIAHLNLIIELEDTFKISFTTEEIQYIDSIEKILKLVNEKS